MSAFGQVAFFPEPTAQSVGELFKTLPNAALASVAEQIDKLYQQNDVPELRVMAVTLKIRLGAPLDEMARHDPVALIRGVKALTKDLAPPGLVDPLMDLADAGTLDLGLAMTEAARLSSDNNALFKRFASYVDTAKEKTYDQWGEDHLRAMAALAAMHEVNQSDWPEGFESYRVARADPETLKLGKEVYDHHEKGCAKCHGEKGQGTLGFPPLAGSPWVLGSPTRAASIVKHGLEGELPDIINPQTGKPFNARMEPLSHLSDAKIAAALTYVRSSWGNFASPVTVDDVMGARQPKEKELGEMYWDAGALVTRYPFNRDTLMGSEEIQPQVASWKAPGLGLIYMLVAVALAMAAILVPTWLGGRSLSDSASHAVPAVA